MTVIPRLNNKRLYEALPDNASTHWDAIIIGSGIGGMSCAAALSRCGERVLVLEQHYLPGGFTHMFARHGFRWDTGVHIVGEMGRNEIPGKILNWLAAGKIHMECTGDLYERFTYEDGRSYDIPSCSEEYIHYLKAQFPDDSQKIDNYFHMVRKAVRKSKRFFAGKLLPQTLDRLLQAIPNGRNYWNMTTAEILDHLDIHGRLRSLLTGQWGYYGNRPESSSFSIHALTQEHFSNGAYYPRGGSVSYAQGLLSAVVEAGGQVYTMAEVQQLLVKNRSITGVELTDGQRFYAPKVISGIGVKNSVSNLLPPAFRESSWAKALRDVKESIPYICLYLGFKGDIRKEGASRSNWWFIKEEEKGRPWWNTADPEESPNTLYLSFPSLKDPEHEQGDEQRQTGECVTFIPWDEMEQWKDSSREKREADYIIWKERIAQRMLKELRQRVPEIMKHLCYYELSSPLTAHHFTRAHHGGIYSLEATPRRFSMLELRPRTPIRGFYLTGVDIAGIGVDSAMVGGMLTASVIHPLLLSRLFLH